MEPDYIYYNNLSFDQNKYFGFEFGDGDQGCFFSKKKKKNNCYIKSISCYVDLTVDVTKLPQFDKVKETLDVVQILVIKETLNKQCMKERAMHLKLIK